MHTPQPMTDVDRAELLEVGTTAARAHLARALDQETYSCGNAVGFHEVDKPVLDALACAGFVDMTPFAGAVQGHHQRWAPELVPAVAALYRLDPWLLDELLRHHRGALSDLIDALAPHPSLVELLAPPQGRIKKRARAAWVRRSIALIQAAS